MRFHTCRALHTSAGLLQKRFTLRPDVTECRSETLVTGVVQTSGWRDVPFGEEVSCSVHQQEHLLLGLGAVSSVQIMLQRYGPLHGADHVNVPLLNTTEDQRTRVRSFRTEL